MELEPTEHGLSIFMAITKLCLGTILFQGYPYCLTQLWYVMKEELDCIVYEPEWLN